MENKTIRVFKEEARKTVSGFEKKWPFGDDISEKFETGCSAECSVLSAQEVAEKIWKEWKHCFELSIHLNAYTEMENSNLYGPSPFRRIP